MRLLEPATWPLSQRAKNVLHVAALAIGQWVFWAVIISVILCVSSLRSGDSLPTLSRIAVEASHFWLFWNVLQIGLGLLWMAEEELGRRRALRRLRTTPLFDSRA